MSVIPLLLRPRVLSTRNRWLSRDRDSASMTRDLVIFSFGLALMLGIYLFFHWALSEADRFSNLAYLPPYIPLSIILLVLFAMLFITSLVSSLGTLYLARDLDFLLSSPIRKSRFFVGKYLDILLSSAWMPMIFIVPVILAFGFYYNASIKFYGLSALVLIPYFMIPPALGVIIAGLFTTVVPARHTRQLLFLALVLFIYFLYRLVELINWGAQNRNDVEEILKMLNVLSLPHVTWLPSHWVARAISESLELGVQGIGLEVSITFFLVITLLSASFLVLMNFHAYAYSKAASGLFLAREDVFFLRKWLKKADNIIPQDLRAMLVKDYSFFLREITQSVQLILLVGIYVVYLYNLRVFRVIGSLPLESRMLWENLVFIINICMGSFVTTAVCTRFVFPSLSLEGKSFWMLLTSPVPKKRILHCKFLIWYPPIAILSSMLLGMGMYVVDIGILPVVVNFASGLVISFGLVGLAVGCGSVFSNFDWEHASQLAASFGSMVYMLGATVLIALNLCFVEAIVFVIKIIPYYRGVSIYFLVALCFSIAFAIFLLNVWVAQKSIERGAQALEKKFR